MKSRFAKFVSIFLVIVLVAGILPIRKGVFAAENETVAETEATNDDGDSDKKSASKPSPTAKPAKEEEKETAATVPETEATKETKETTEPETNKEDDRSGKDEPGDNGKTPDSTSAPANEPSEEEPTEETTAPAKKSGKQPDENAKTSGRNASTEISSVSVTITEPKAGANPAVAQIIIYQDAQDSSLKPLYIYALRDPLPKARLVDPHLTQELPEFAQFIRDNYPTYQAGSLYEPNIGSNPSIGTADILHEGHNYLTISTECSRDSFLIVSNTYHPNWRISIDDSPPVPVTRVNYAFQGAPIPAGKHRVTLRFASPAFDLGWKISAATLLALLALWGWSAFRNRPHFG